MASNLRSYPPRGAHVKTLDTASRSRLPFFERIKYCDEQIVVVATSGMLGSKM